MIRITQDSGNRKVFIKIERMADDILSEIEKAYWEVGHLLRNYLRKGLRFGARKGNWYTHVNPMTGKEFRRRSSAPGEFPQRITGTLRGAVVFKVISYKQLIFGIENPSKGKDTSYAIGLEEGIPGLLKKRKLVGYTVNRMHQQTKNLLIKRLNKAVKEL